VQHRAVDRDGVAAVGPGVEQADQVPPQAADPRRQGAGQAIRPSSVRRPRSARISGVGWSRIASSPSTVWTSRTSMITSAFKKSRSG
jgi:hypothetical protein